MDSQHYLFIYVLLGYLLGDLFELRVNDDTAHNQLQQTEKIKVTE